MRITEWLANLPLPWVLAIVAFLLGLRFYLKKRQEPIAKSIGEVSESLAIAMALVFLLIRPFVVEAFYIPSGSMEPTLMENDQILVNKFIYRFTQPKLGDVVVFKSPPAANADEKNFIKRVIAVPGDLVHITPGYVMIGDTKYDHEDLRNLLGLDPDNGKVRLISGKIYADGKLVKLKELAELAGQPDTKVKVVPGRVFIDDKPLTEPYIAEDPDLPYPLPSTPNQKSIVKKGGEWEVKIPKGKLLVMGDNRNRSNDARFWGLLDRSRMKGKAMFIFWPLGRIRWIH